MSTTASDINSGNGTYGRSNNGNFITKAWSYLSFRVRRRFNPVPPDLEAEGVQCEIDESHGNDESREIELSEINSRETPPTVQADQMQTDAGNSITNGLADTNDDLLKYLQKIGLKVVKYLVMPTSLVVAPNAIATAVNLFQVFTANNAVAASTKTFFLKPYFASAIVNISLGVILFMLSTSTENFQGKVFVLKVTILLTSASTVMEIALLFAAGWQFVSLV